MAKALPPNATTVPLADPPAAFVEIIREDSTSRDPPVHARRECGGLGAAAATATLIRVAARPEQADEQGWPEAVRPYAVARSGLVARATSEVLHIDPTRAASAPFLRSLERLDRLIYAPAGMATPRWAFYDCAELPGVVFGRCVPASRLPAEARVALAVADEEAPVPLDAVVAIPTVAAGHWLVFAVCGLQEVVETGHADRRAESLRAALRWLGAREVSSVCQWRGDRLALHLRWGPLEVRAAWMPSHDLPASCCLRHGTEGDAPALDAASKTWLATNDAEGLRALQARIEAGGRYYVVAVRDEADAAASVALCEAAGT